MDRFRYCVLFSAMIAFGVGTAARLCPGADAAGRASGSYAVVVSKSTWDAPEWKEVVDALRKKHDAAVIVYAGSIRDARGELRRIMPRYACFVAKPEEAGRDFVVSVHRMTRRLDDDPYTDVIWGILTGYNAEDALRIVQRTDPLIVRRGLGGCGSLNLSAYEEGIKFNEGVAGGRWVKRPGEPEVREDFPTDSTKGLVDAFNEFKPDVFMTSGHATEKDWQIGYNYPDGSFRCADGQLFGTDTQGRRYDVNSPNSKIFMPVGNCLIGHIPGRDCMALAMMHSAGVDQMFGYTAVTFYGFIGWGVNDYFEGQRDRYTFAESFYLINQALIHELFTKHPGIANIDFDRYDPEAIEVLARQHELEKRDELGLLWDRDVVAFYGDPAWEARRTPGSPAWTQTLDERNGTYTLTVRATGDGQWGKHPVMFLLPERLEDVQVTHGEELMPVVTDNLVLLPLAGEHAKGAEAKVVFKARKAKVLKTSAATDPIFVPASRPKPETVAPLREATPLPPAEIPEPYRREVAAALERAGDNRGALAEAIRSAPEPWKEAVCFLIANMPDVDLQTLTTSYLSENVKWAYQARDQLPWGREIPHELFLNYVLPYASINERRDNWRGDFYNRFRPVVRDCQTAAEGAQKLNREIFDLVEVRYHATKRPKPDQSPYESIAAGYASCTGLSVLLVDACRAVGIPARLVGVPQWTAKPGNHTWVEVWDGQWYFLGAAEPDPQGLNRAWFVGDAARADPTNLINRIYTASFRRTPVSFPLVWDSEIDYVKARDVTAYYTNRKNVGITVLDRPQGRPVAAKVALFLDGELHAVGRTGDSPTGENSGVEFELPGGREFDVEIRTAGMSTIRTTLTTTDEADQDVPFTLGGN